MADTKISALTSASTPLAGTEVFPLVQSGTTKKATIDNILNAGRSASFGAVNGTSKYTITGNGSTPAATDMGWGTNGVGSRMALNCPAGGEYNFAIGGTNAAGISPTAVYPTSDNALSCGLSFWRWSVVYAATALINTSDARTKQQIRNLDDAEQAVAKRIKGLVKAFKFNDSVDEKGDGARIHIGVVAQEIAEAFVAEGLDPNRYSMFCHDSWDDMFEDVYEEQVIDREDGTSETVSVKVGTRQVVKAGDRYGIRYEELLAFVIAAL